MMKKCHFAVANSWLWFLRGKKLSHKIERGLREDADHWQRVYGSQIAAEMLRHIAQGLNVESDPRLVAPF